MSTTRSPAPAGAARRPARSPDLDVVRAVAALAVLAGHAYLLGGHRALARTDTRPLAMLLNHLGAGIWLFFALSGYLIAGPFIRALLAGTALPATRGYLVRRGFRILPAYWAALAAMVLLTPAHLTLSTLLIHVTLVHNLFPGQGQAVFFVAWTLGIEALFYLFVPLAAWAVWRVVGPRVSVGRMTALVLTAWALSSAYAVVVNGVFGFGPGQAPPYGGDVMRNNLPPMLSGFCPGMLIAVLTSPEGRASSGWLPRAYRAVTRRAGPPLLAAVAAFAVACVVDTSPRPWVSGLHQQPLILASGLAVATVMEPRRWMRPVAAVLAPVGVVSYGVYLWHWVIVHAVDDHTHLFSGWPAMSTYPARIAILAAAAIAVATVSWLLVERPLIARAERWTRRRGLVGRRAVAEPAAVVAATPSPVPAALSEAAVPEVTG